MLINASKTELLLCGDRRQLCRIAEPPTITFMDQTLTCSNRVKNLGVIMDSNLSWELHVNHVIGICFGILIGLQNAKHLLPQRLLPRIIDALVFSHVRHCAQVYGSANCTTIAKLQKLFNFAARVVSGRRRSDHISDVLKTLNWLNVQRHTMYFDMCLLHKVLRESEPEDLRSQLSYNSEHTTRVTRHSNHLALPRPRNNHGKRAYSYRAVSLYNRFAIDEGIASLTVPVFKRCLKELLKNSNE